MPLSLTDLLYGCATPAVWAVLVVGIVQRVPFATTLRQPAAGLGLAGGFLLAYGLVGLGPWLPRASWSYLPWVAIASIVVGLLCDWISIATAWRATGCIVASAIVAWLLTPNWDNLQPSRFVYVSGTTGYLIVLVAGLNALARRMPDSLLAFALTAAFVAGTAILIRSGNLRFAQMSASCASAMAGVTLATLWQRGKTRGAVLPYAWLATGLMLVGQVGATRAVPWPSFALPPLAPLLLWLGLVGPMCPLPGRSRWVLSAGLMFAVLVVAVGLAWIP